MEKKLRLIEINTTAYDEENFCLVTNLTDKQITKVLNPIVGKERIGEEFYDNEDLAYALNEVYPSETIIFFDITNLERIII